MTRRREDEPAVSPARRVIYVAANAIRKGKDGPAVLVAGTLDGRVDLAEAHRTLRVTCPCGQFVGEFRCDPSPPPDQPVRVWFEVGAETVLVEEA